MAHQLPSIDQIAMLPGPVHGVVTPEFIDANGHMNVLHFLDFGSRGAEALVERAGIDDAYRATRRMGLFTAEHHLAYYSELKRGDTFAAHARVLDRSDKALHLMTFLVDLSANRLSNTLEILLVHVDLDTRHPARLPTDVAAALDTHIARSNGLNWVAPICGAIGIRRVRPA